MTIEIGGIPLLYWNLGILCFGVFASAIHAFASHGSVSILGFQSGLGKYEASRKAKSQSIEREARNKHFSE
jgi:hypothetical protein